MAPNKLPLTGDLRSEAREYQRDRNHNAKWARGFAPAVGKTCPHTCNGRLEACIECAVRPALLDRATRHNKHHPSLKSNFRKHTLNSVLTADDITGPSDSSAGEDDLKGPSDAAVDAKVIYSFDAATSPGQGNDILSSAINRAVERYENKVTEKLAKEYEFVDSSKEHGDGYAADADDDDYEMVDHETFQ